MTGRVLSHPDKEGPTVSKITIYLFIYLSIYIIIYSEAVCM